MKVEVSRCVNICRQLWSSPAAPGLWSPPGDEESALLLPHSPTLSWANLGREESCIYLPTHPSNPLASPEHRQTLDEEPESSAQHVPAAFKPSLTLFLLKVAGLLQVTYHEFFGFHGQSLGAVVYGNQQNQTSNLPGGPPTLSSAFISPERLWLCLCYASSGPVRTSTRSDQRPPFHQSRSEPETLKGTTILRSPAMLLHQRGHMTQPGLPPRNRSPCGA